ncbi:hypothetical protein B6D29_03735 [Microgenomates bacterium UTCPR1]|nr:MAG: hypothetical protein B6D29_03735 [Microgenomates bacterium UTCPR1]
MDESVRSLEPKVKPRKFAKRSIGGRWSQFTDDQTAKTGIVGEMTMLFGKRPFGVLAKPVYHIRTVWTLHSDGTVVPRIYDNFTGKEIPREKNGNYSVGRNGRIEYDPETNETLLAFDEYFEPSFYQETSSQK